MNKSIAMTMMAVMFWAILVSCQGENKAETDSVKTSKGGTMTIAEMEVTSPAFKDGETIPTQYTCDSRDVSVPLAWTKAPEGTKSIALICDDPDAPRGTWVHWVAINLPPDLIGLAEGVKIAEDSSLAGAIECGNDAGKIGYGGPCPPKGPAHRYFFKLYALDTMLELTAKSEKADVEKAMAGHILAQGQLMGRYGR